MTLWEIATLQSLGRMTVKADFQGWLEQITARLLAQPVAISPAIASEVAALPDTFHCDPGDRATVTLG